MNISSLIVILIIFGLILGITTWKAFSAAPKADFDTGYFKERLGIGIKKPERTLDVKGNVGWTGTLEKGSVPWQRLTEFPQNCPTGQFVKGVGSDLLCEPFALSSLPPEESAKSISWINIIDFPSGCPVGQFVKSIGAELTCAPAPGGTSVTTTGGLGGGGTKNYLARWTSGASLGDSIVYDAGGKIGIGTTSPTQLLTLSSSGVTRLSVRSGTNFSVFGMDPNDGPYISWINTKPLRFSTAGGDNGLGWSEKMRITADGNVGIGVASPTQKLDVAGYVKATGLCIGADCRTSWPTGGTTDSGGLGGSGTPPALTRWLGTPGSSSTSLGNSGVYQVGSNIGIGIQNPEQKLHIDGNAQAAIFYASTGISTFDAFVQSGTIEASRFCLGNGTNCITSWPGGVGGGDISAVIAGTGLSGGGDTGSVTLSADTTYLQRRISGTCGGGSAIRVINSDGTVACEAVAGGGGFWTQSGNSLYPNNLTWNLGIGTSSPAYKLDITGDIRWTGVLQGGSVPWARLTSFPSPCLSGQYVSGIGTGGLTCSTPAGTGGGTVAQINQGAGITLSPNPITTTGTISLTTQNCPNGQFVTGISGAISCATPPVGGGGGGGWTDDGTIVRLTTSTDSVGIGTTNPSSAQLQVQASGTAIMASSSGAIGVYASGRSYGVYGSGLTGIFGSGTSTGVHGEGPNYGVFGAGNIGGYDFFAAGYGIDYGTSSSIRWKKNIQPIDNALGKVLSLRGVYFDWDDEHGGLHAIGMIGEEVGKVLPEIVAYERDGVYTSGMDYSKLTPLLVEAVKELKAENDKLRSRIEVLESKLK